LQSASQFVSPCFYTVTSVLTAARIHLLLLRTCRPIVTVVLTATIGVTFVAYTRGGVEAQAAASPIVPGMSMPLYRYLHLDCSLDPLLLLRTCRPLIVTVVLTAAKTLYYFKRVAPYRHLVPTSTSTPCSLIIGMTCFVACTPEAGGIEAQGGR
jgi:hypothetical protein